ncbi:MAG: MBL fold metallo-hydrolase [Deltaproteobacteria bacterium]|nr:MBL fold metallo-hydrolase [Deltaproteobacteria bacterium]MBI3077470.1 MBL fold metallo-hydrolase [Deltaproteobacteria bacterium]
MRMRQLLAVGIVLAVAMGAVWLGAAPGWAQQPRYATTKVADDVYMFRWIGHQALFVVTPDGVIATDPISVEAAKVYREEIKKITPQPVRYVIYSHHHFDHITGGAAFADTAIFVAHARTRQRLLELMNPNVPLPSVTYRDRMTLELGGRKVELHYVGRNHTDNSTVVLVPDQKVLFAVDFIPIRSLQFRVMYDTYPMELIESLKRVELMDFNILVPGHGPISNKDAVREHREYLQDLAAEVKKYLDRGVSLVDTIRQLKLPKYEKWGGYEQFLPMNVERFFEYYRRGV